MVLSNDAENEFLLGYDAEKNLQTPCITGQLNTFDFRLKWIWRCLQPLTQQMIGQYTNA